MIVFKGTCVDSIQMMNESLFSTLIRAVFQNSTGETLVASRVFAAGRKGTWNILRQNSLPSTSTSHAFARLSWLVLNEQVDSQELRSRDHVERMAPERSCWDRFVRWILCTGWQSRPTHQTVFFHYGYGVYFTTAKTSWERLNFLENPIKCERICVCERDLSSSGTCSWLITRKFHSSRRKNTAIWHKVVNVICNVTL